MLINKKLFQISMTDDHDNDEKDYFSNRGQKPDSEQKPPASDKPKPDKD